MIHINNLPTSLGQWKRYFDQTFKIIEELVPVISFGQNKIEYILSNLYKFKNSYLESHQPSVPPKEGSILFEFFKTCTAFVAFISQYTDENILNYFVTHHINYQYEELSQLWDAWSVQSSLLLINSFNDFTKFNYVNYRDLKLIYRALTHLLRNSKISIPVANALRGKIDDILLLLTMTSYTIDQNSPGIIHHSDFEYIKEIGRGAFATVMLAKYKPTGQEIAVKELKQVQLTKRNVVTLKRELNILLRLKHPNILQFIGVTVTPPFCIETAYINNGSLFDRLRGDKALSPYEKQKIALCMARGLEYLDAMRFIHRDFKSQNVLLDKECNAVICDFGISRQIGPKMTPEIGTAQWTAPEVLSPSQTNYDTSADTYSFAIVMWELATKKLPFYNLRQTQVAASVLTKGSRPEFPDDDSVPFELRKLIEQSWSQDPRQRPKMTQIRKSLQKCEAFFKGLNDDEIEEISQNTSESRREKSDPTSESRKEKSEITTESKRDKSEVTSESKKDKSEPKEDEIHEEEEEKNSSKEEQKEEEVIEEEEIEEEIIVEEEEEEKSESDEEKYQSDSKEERYNYDSDDKKPKKIKYKKIKVKRLVPVKKKQSKSSKNEQKGAKNESSTNKQKQDDDESSTKEEASTSKKQEESSSKQVQRINYKEEYLKWVEETKEEHKRIMKIARDSAAREEALLLEKLHTLNPLDSSALKVIEQLYHIDYPLTLELFEEILRLTNQTLSIPVQDAAFDVMKQILSRDDLTTVIDTTKIVDELITMMDTQPLFLITAVKIIAGKIRNIEEMINKFLRMTQSHVTLELIQALISKNKNKLDKNPDFIIDIFKMLHGQFAVAFFRFMMAMFGPKQEFLKYACETIIFLSLFIKELAKLCETDVEYVKNMLDMPELKDEGRGALQQTLDMISVVFINPDGETNEKMVSIIVKFVIQKCFEFNSHNPILPLLCICSTVESKREEIAKIDNIWSFIMGGITTDNSVELKGISKILISVSTTRSKNKFISSFNFNNISNNNIIAINHKSALILIENLPLCETQSVRIDIWNKLAQTFIISHDPYTAHAISSLMKRSNEFDYNDLIPTILEGVRNENDSMFCLTSLKLCRSLNANADKVLIDGNIFDFICTQIPKKDNEVNKSIGKLLTKMVQTMDEEFPFISDLFATILLYLYDQDTQLEVAKPFIVFLTNACKSQRILYYLQKRYFVKYIEQLPWRYENENEVADVIEYCVTYLTKLYPLSSDNA